MVVRVAIAASWMNAESAPRPVSPDAVRLLARQIWERTHAPALDNWLAAERQLNAAAPSMEAAAHAMNGA